MQLSDNRLSPYNLTLFATYAIALLYFSTLIPELIHYVADNGSIQVKRSSIALLLLTLLLLVLGYLYQNGHRYAIHIASIGMALATPFIFDPQAFSNSTVPQEIWLPFVFALIVSQFRIAIVTLVISFGLAVFTYPDALRTPFSIVETVIIGLLLILARFILPRLISSNLEFNTATTSIGQAEVQSQRINENTEHSPNLTTEKNFATTLEQQQAFIQFAPISIAMLDKDMNYLAVSQKWCQENSRGYEHLIGRNHYDVNPDIPLECKSQYQQALAGATIQNTEFMWQQNDGLQRWLRCSLQPWRTQKNEVGGIIITCEEITDQKITESDLNSVLEESGDAIWICDGTGAFIYANPTASNLTGYSSSDFNNLRLIDIIQEEHEDELLEYLALTKYSKFTHREWMLKHKNGSTVNVELTTGHLPGDRIIALARNLTQKMKIESERFKLFQAVEQSPGCIMITNLDGEIEYVNTAFLKRTGYTQKEIIGKNPRIIKSGKTPSQVFVELWKTIKEGKTWQGEISNVSKNGQEFILFTTISVIRQMDGTISAYLAIGEDITIRKKGEERIFELAYFDQLTGLPNRTLLLDRLNQVISISSRSGVFGALLFIDLDHFKNINDTFGHQKGDLVLKQVAECLMLRIREGDTVSRFGGDEFVVLLTDLGTDDELAANKAKSVSLKLLEALNQTYQLGEVVHHSSASIGVAMFNGKYSNTDDLLKQADLAMYKSKKAGRNTLRFFDPSLESAMRQQSTMEEDLRRALKDQQFILQYQGQFTNNAKLIGAEILLRWKHPERGVMPPALFMPFAEETGVILPLGNWILETACNQLVLWEQISSKRELTLAVNISALQFKQTNFVETVLAIIKRTGANPQRLRLELTENMVIDNVDDIIQKNVGVKKCWNSLFIRRFRYWIFFALFPKTPPHRSTKNRPRFYP